MKCADQYELLTGKCLGLTTLLRFPQEDKSMFLLGDAGGKRIKQDLEVEVSDCGIHNISPGLKASGSNL